jgi:anti-anti-sigma factor
VTSALRVEHRDTQSVAVIELHGDVTGDGEDPITEAFASVTSDGPATVLIVLADTQYINTAGISVLIRLAMEAKRAGHRLLVSGASPHYQKVFDLVRFSQFVSMYDTEDEALASLDSP